MNIKYDNYLSQQKRCDRCGSYYDEYDCGDSINKINSFMTLSIDSKQSYFKHGPYDLCPTCSTGLMEWFNEIRKENR